MPTFETFLANGCQVPPDTPLQVDGVRPLGNPEFEDGFVVETSRFTLTDGSRYGVRQFRPDRPRFDISTTYTTPWCTYLDGFNRRPGEALAREGITTIVVSPEQLRVRQIHRLGSLSLKHDVEAHHAILDHIDTTEIAPTAPRQTISIGYSRGAMIGFGLNATSPAHTRDIRYSDYVDPCLEHGVGPRDVDWAQIPGYMAQEVFELGKGLGNYRMSELLPLARGAWRPSVGFWLQQIALTKTLFSGEAGTFVDGWHTNSVAHVGLYTRSRFNHAQQWQERFAHLPNVDITTEPGLHLSGVDPKVLRGTVARVVLAQELIKQHAAPAEIHATIHAWQPRTRPKKPAVYRTSSN